MAYTDINEVQTFLKTTFTSSTVPSDTTVAQWITDVDSEVDNLVGTTFTSTEETEIFDLRQFSDRVLLSKYPVISVTSAEYNNKAAGGTEYSPVWAAFDNFRNNDSLVKYDKQLQGDQMVKVVYNYGYATVPSEVKHLATLLVVKKALSSDSYAKNSTSSLSIGPLSITKNIGASTFVNIDANIKETLRRIGKYTTVFK